MIVDTSALVAAVRGEPGYDALVETMASVPSLVPAPVLVEFARVVADARNEVSGEVARFLDTLFAGIAQAEPFTAEDARIAKAANARYGTGNGRGGTLNMLDLMVYAVAQRTGRPILCTGADFAATDAAIHASSRVPDSRVARP